jgi:sulfotransferase family protein
MRDPFRKHPPIGVCDRPCFFIVGPPRSGTTMVRLLLNSHPDVAVPAETWFFPKVLLRGREFGDFSTPQQVESFARAVTEATSETLRPVSQVFGVSAEELAEAVSAAGVRCYADGFWAFLDLLARREGKRLWGEKTPYYSAWLGKLGEAFPNARFLAIVRDPRDVVASLHGIDWGRRFYPTLADGGMRWRYAMDGVEQARPRLGERLRMVRYEDLVAAPESEVRALCDFLGVPFTPEMLRFYETAHRALPPGVDGWHSRVKEPINASRVGLWRRQFTPEEVGLIERAAGPSLAAWGYQPEGLPNTLRNHTRLAAWKVRSALGKVPWIPVARPV